MFVMIGTGLAIFIFGIFLVDHLRKEEKKRDPKLLPDHPTDHAYRGSLSAAVARADALERENQELRNLPEAAENCRRYPDTSRSGFDVYYPWSEDLKPGHYIQTETSCGVVVVVEDDRLWVHFDNGTTTWRQWVERF